MRHAILMVLITLMLLPAGQAWAQGQTRYVSDELVVLLRQGQSEKFKILKMLKANTPMEVLQEEEEYLHVRIQDGTEGYVLKQYITSDTPKPVIIGRLEKERDKLREQVKQLQAQQAQLSGELGTVRQEHTSGEALANSLRQELEAVQAKFDSLQEQSAKVVEIAAERDRLEAQNTDLSAEVDRLRQDNEEMFFTGAIKWFLAGGGVLLLGIVLGKLSRRKKKGFSY
ncbi:MAG: TIGR04211 family SH3 domain-containing protein [Desulfuromonadales bacterium]|nr:TIGR04211 family SH3 domain-containing protein [Desulfuromonadales bacterium]